MGRYQPMVIGGGLTAIDTATERVVSFEALVRWERPGHGEVSPALFIPVAEAGGLIEAVDACVLRAACREAQSWEQALGVCVNISTVWLSDNRLGTISQIILGPVGRAHTVTSLLSSVDGHGRARRMGAGRTKITVAIRPGTMPRPKKTMAGMR